MRRYITSTLSLSLAFFDPSVYLFPFSFDLSICEVILRIWRIYEYFSGPLSEESVIIFREEFRTFCVRDIGARIKIESSDLPGAFVEKFLRSVPLVRIGRVECFVYHKKKSEKIENYLISSLQKFACGLSQSIPLVFISWLDFSRTSSIVSHSTPRVSSVQFWYVKCKIKRIKVKIKK